MPTTDCLVTGVFLWDGRSERRSRDPVALRVRDGRIDAIGPAVLGPKPVPGTRLGAEPVFSFRPEDGATAIPGLIDAHVHLTLDPSIRNAADQISQSPQVLWDGMVLRAEAMVRAGITTARDLGGGKWRELELRDRIDAGELSGPRVLCAGQPLTSPGGHCHFWGGEAKGSTQVRAVIDRQVRHGVDWIKVMATGGVITKGTDIRAAQYDEVELREIVLHARGLGCEVAAHCHGNLGIRNAVASGVRTIEHCSFAGKEGFGADFDAALVSSIAASEAWVSPTVNEGWGRRISKDGEPSRFFERMSRCLGSLREAGARFVASTDAGIPGVYHDRLVLGLEALARYSGMSPVDVLRSATSESARALGIADETGTLAAGFAADLMVVSGNPLTDLSLLRSPELVLARGQAFKS